MEENAFSKGLRMSVTLKTRKPVDKLTLADFAAFRVWEYATDEEGEGEQDETWVRPVKNVAVRRGEYSQLVATTFRTASGGALQGFMIVTTAEEPVEVSAGAVMGAGLYAILPTMSRSAATTQNFLWVNQARDELCRRLRMKEAVLFPLTFVLEALIAGEKQPRSGMVE